MSYNLQDLVKQTNLLEQQNKEARIVQESAKLQAIRAYDLQVAVYNVTRINVFVRPEKNPVARMKWDRTDLEFYFEDGLKVRFNPVWSVASTRPENYIVGKANDFATLPKWIEEQLARYDKFKSRLADQEGRHSNKVPSPETIQSLMKSGEWFGTKREPLPPLEPPADLFRMAQIVEIYNLAPLENGSGYVGKNFIEEGAQRDGFVLFTDGANVGGARDRKINKTYSPIEVARAIGVPLSRYEGYRLHCELMGGELIERAKEPE
jgi:hypothetical protein